MSVNIIAVIGRNNEIGKNNKLIWRLPKDLKFFKDMTMGKYVVMGRKTYESLPNNLPGRTCIVISSHKLDSFCDAIFYDDLDVALATFDDSDVFVIGGQSIYRQAIKVADTMYLTEVEAEDSYADAYFPRINKNEWDIEELESGIDNDILYKRKKYVRKKWDNEG